nr:hypothetical protein pEA19081_p10 [Enterococcus avium]
MHGVDRGKNWRLFQKFTYRYLHIIFLNYAKKRFLKDQ